MARVPQAPPPLPGDPNEIARLIALRGSSSVRDEYLHWDKLRFRKPPEGMTVTEWWQICRLQRSLQQRPLPLLGTDGAPFTFQVPPQLQETLYHITMEGGASVIAPDLAHSTGERDRRRTQQLIEEAISSSLIEGAVTTRVEAERMLRSDRKPTTKSDRMIVNNYRAMRRLSELRDAALTPELIRELQRTLTDGTLEHPEEAGRFRREEDRIVVADLQGIVYHRPPEARQLPERIERLCAFANEKDATEFIHPVVRSILLHLWLAYDHPFTDGNGRVARALFYWSMLRHGFWMIEHLSISRIIYRSKSSYYESFLYVETDGNDATYFLLHQADVLMKAINELRAYMKHRAGQRAEIDRRIAAQPGLNERQRALLYHALSHPGYRYTIAEHQQKCGVAYATARWDLLDLANQGLLLPSKEGRALAFRPVADLEARVAVQ
jgi:Fic family protein